MHDGSMIEVLLATVLAIMFVISPLTVLLHLTLNWLASYSNPGRHRKSSAHQEWRNIQ